MNSFDLVSLSNVLPNLVSLQSIGLGKTIAYKTARTDAGRPVSGIRPTPLASVGRSLRPPLNLEGECLTDDGLDLPAGLMATTQVGGGLHLHEATTEVGSQALQTQGDLVLVVTTRPKEESRPIYPLGEDLKIR